MDVGLALLEIRDQRLYKDAGFSAFDAYRRERLGWTARRNNQLIEAAEVIYESHPERR